MYDRLVRQEDPEVNTGPGLRVSELMVGGGERGVVPPRRESE